MPARNEAEPVFVRTREDESLRGVESVPGLGEAADGEIADVGHAPVADGGHDEWMSLQEGRRPQG